MSRSPEGIQMKSRISLDTVIKLTRMGSAPVFSWPLPSNASHATILKRGIFWWMTIIHNVVSSSMLLNDICRSASYDIDHAISVLAELGAPLMTTAAMMLCKAEETRLQVLLGELRLFMKKANKEELHLIQSHVDKSLFFHSLILSGAVFGPILFILAPAMTNQHLPSAANYPYSMESTGVWAATYVSQSIITIQIGSTAILDFLFAILLWYTGARMEMLSMQLRRATTHEEVKRCIREHQYLLEYVEQLKTPTRIIATEVTSIAIFAVVSSGLILMRSERVAAAAFDCKWVGKSPDMTKDLLLITHRAQTPVLIDLPGITPALTLDFYTSTMKVTFSYLTTLHAMVDN